MQTLNALARPFHTRILYTIVALLFVMGSVGAVNVSGTAFAAPTKTRHANEIVQFGNHQVTIRPITFDKKVITGLDALQLSGFKVVTVDTQFGPAVCSVNGVGMPADNCFGDPQGRYWGYNYWDGTTWQSYQVGAGSSQVKEGAVEGWRWGQFGDSVYPATPVLAGEKALQWLQKQESAADGGYGGPSATTDSELAVGADELNASRWKRNDTAPSLTNYQKEHAKEYSKTLASAAGKLAVALVGTNSCFPKKTRLPSHYYDSNTGIYMEGAGPQSWSMLGTAAVHETIPAAAVTYLKGLAKPNGGFEWSPGWGTDTNSTALAIQALVAAGEATNSTTIVNAVAYLSTAQNDDGGFPYDPDSNASTASDANSTAWAVQGLYAAGQDPFSADWTKTKNPLEYLEDLQLGNGSLEWQPGTGANLLATQQAIPVLLGTPYPLNVQDITHCK